MSERGAPRILRVELNYGRHRGAAFDVPDSDRPVVIAGPNGAGKTTLLEGVARGLCGFNRRVDEDSALLDARGDGVGDCWCTVRLRDGEGRTLELKRSFGDARVRLTDVDDDRVLFEGDANPGGNNEDTRRFRTALERILGFGQLGPWRATAFVGQGELIETRLDRDLVRAATGGGGGVDAALEDVAGRHRALTRRPLHADDRGGRKARRLEELEAELDELRGQIAETERLERRRSTVLYELGAVEEDLRKAGRRRDRLRDALEPLHARATLQTEVERLGERHERATRALEALRSARKAAEEASREREKRADGYPADFREKVAAARQLWPRKERLEARRAEALNARAAREAEARARRTRAAVAAGVAGVLAMAAGVTGAFWLWALVAVAAAVALWLWLGSRPDADLPDAVASTEEELTGVEAELTELTACVPGEDRLTPESAELHLNRFAEQKEADRAWEHAREALDRAVTTARDALGDADAEAGGLVRRLEELVATLLKDRAREEVKLEQRQEAVDLPDDVPPEPDAVQRALRGADSAVKELEERAGALKESLYREASPTRSATALRDEKARVEERLADVVQRAAALAGAWDLLRTAHESFREGDEDRLLGGVSGRLEALTSGQLGPVESGDGLESATVVILGRRTRLDSPGLSYGERMATRLAIRLAAADFLARNGVRPPLIVDEPFDDLDPERSRGAWELLSRIAGERQVIVASQDRLVLEWLGVEPDVELER